MDRPESLMLGWLLIVGGAAMTLLRYRLAEYRRDLQEGRRAPGPRWRQADLEINRVVLAAIGVLLMVGGLLLIAEEPVRRLLGVS